MDYDMDDDDMDDDDRDDDDMDDDDRYDDDMDGDNDEKIKRFGSCLQPTSSGGPLYSRPMEPLQNILANIICTFESSKCLMF